MAVWIESTLSVSPAFCIHPPPSYSSLVILYTFYLDAYNPLTRITFSSRLLELSRGEVQSFQIGAIWKLTFDKVYVRILLSWEVMDKIFYLKFFLQVEYWEKVR